MISWLHDGGISGWWKYSAYLSAFLPGERTPCCALARSNVIYVCSSYTCLHTGDSTTPLLSVQRVSPLRFVGINKQHFFLFSFSCFLFLSCPFLLFLSFLFSLFLFRFFASYYFLPFPFLCLLYSFLCFFFPMNLRLCRSYA